MTALSDGVLIDRCFVCNAETTGLPYCSWFHMVRGATAIKIRLAPDDELALLSPNNLPQIDTAPNQSRGGDTYRTVLKAGKWAEVEKGISDLDDVIAWLNKHHKHLKADRNSVRRSWIRYQEVRQLELARTMMTVDPKYIEMLGPPVPATGTKADIDTWVEDAAQAFTDWRKEFFRTSHGGGYITPAYQRKWIRHWMRGFASKRKKRGVLSPPRSGKTDLLIHLVVWLILRNPNIRIVWIGPNEDIAVNSVDAVRDILSSHDKLIETYLPPGLTFEPVGTGAKKEWSAKALTVSTRTIVGQKASTLLARGRTGRLLSLDADVIIGDDLVDFESMMTEGARKQVKGWFLTTLSSRASANTVFFVIGSRVHHLDLYQALLDADNWDLIVERAHDRDCVIDRWDVSAHDAAHCLLAGELPDVDYQWLLDKQTEAEAAGQPELFDLVYLNDVTGSMSSAFLREDIRNCMDPMREVGIEGLKEGYVLLAGLDPAYSGHQASVLMAYYPDDGTYALVDLDNPKGGGVDKFLQQMEKYESITKGGLEEWVVEVNAVQGIILDDPRVKEFGRQHRVDFHRHKTHSNRNDEQFGVVGMARLFREGEISLPYSNHDPATRRKIDMLERQLLSFDGIAQGRSSRGLTDLVMAMWFTVLWAKKIHRRLGDERHRVAVGGEFSFPDYQQSFDNTAPWGPSSYPYTTQQRVK